VASLSSADPPRGRAVGSRGIGKVAGAREQRKGRACGRPKQTILLGGRDFAGGLVSSAPPPSPKDGPHRTSGGREGGEGGRPRAIESLARAGGGAYSATVDLTALFACVRKLVKSHAHGGGVQGAFGRSAGLGISFWDRFYFHGMRF